MNAQNSMLVALAIGLMAFLLPNWVLWVLLIIVSLFTTFFAVLDTVTTGRMKFHVQGENYIQTVRTTSTRDPFQFLIWKLFGKHFFGWSFFNHSVKSFDINTDIENPWNTPGDETTWKIVRKEPRKVTELWEKVPRILTLYNVEIGGDNPLQISLKILMVLNVSHYIDGDGLDGGARFVFKYNSDFTKPEDLATEKIIKKIAKQCKTYKDVIDAPADMLDEIKFDSDLIENLREFGFDLEILKITDVATDKSIEIVSRKKTIAEAENEVKIMNAKAEAQAILIIAKAKADGLTLEEIAKSQPLIDLINSAYPGATQEQRLNMVTNLLSKKALGGADSKITHLITDLF